MELHDRTIEYDQDSGQVLSNFFPIEEIPTEKNVKDALHRLSRNANPAIADKARALIRFAIAFGESGLESKTKVTTAEDVYVRLRHRLGVLKEEVMVALFFDKSGTLIQEMVLNVGLTDTTSARAKEIFSHAVEYRATSLILAHNHPSGNKQPSAEDISATHKLFKVGEFLDIELRDHIIITQQGFFSFCRSGLLHPGVQKDTNINLILYAKVNKP